MGAQFFSLVLRRFPPKPGPQRPHASDQPIQRVEHYQPVRSEWWSGTEKDGIRPKTGELEKVNEQ